VIKVTNQLELPPNIYLHNSLKGEEVILINRKCKGCGHRRPIFNQYPNLLGCNYILDTGHPRGCPVDECPHYTAEKCHILDDIRYEREEDYICLNE
jgi:hypothetical protein